MSNSSSSIDSGLTQFYQRALSRLEDAIHEEGKKTRERNDEQTRKTEERYQENFKKKEEDSDAAIRYIRDSADESLIKEKEKYQAELDHLKDQTYNNRGISGA